jgi:hypothetical protein
MAKYSKGAGEKVKDVMHEMKRGKLKSGTGKKVTSRKQAIAIALSEAREEGEKVPAKKGSKPASKSRSKSASKKTSKSSGRSKGLKSSASKKKR